MSEQHPHRATIPPVPDEVSRPLWSVMIPNHNSATYLRETLASILVQDPGPDAMQIEVVDDHSTLDDPEAVVEELGSGRVGFYRQLENVGHTRNFKTCLERSRGKLIHLLHGDDLVLDGFYRKMEQAFAENSEIGAAFCRHIFMDGDGHWRSISALEQPRSGVLDNWLERIAVKQRIQTPSVVVRRDVYEKLGGFDYRLSWTEDWEMWVRIASYYPVWYEVRPLALYRMHSASNTGSYMRTGENVRDLRRAISIIHQHLPNEYADRISKAARKHSAFYALNSAKDLAEAGNRPAVTPQIVEALRCCLSWGTVKQALYLLMKSAFI